MGKWYAGMVFSGVALLAFCLVLFSAPFQPWWTVTSDWQLYNGETVTWRQNYCLSGGYLESDFEWDMDGDDDNESVSEFYPYDTKANASYPAAASNNLTINTAEALFAMDGDAEDGAQPSTMTTWRNINYIFIASFILNILAFISLPVVGYNKLSPTVPKVLMMICAFMVLGAAFYAVFGIPSAMDKDDIAYEEEVWRQTHGGTLVGYTHEQREETKFYWGNYGVEDPNDPYVLKETVTWGAGLGWYLTILVFILMLIGSAFVYPTSAPTNKTKEPQEPAQTCSRCGGELKWIPQYARWYCNSCHKYAGQPETRFETVEKRSVTVGPQAAGPEEEEDDDELDW